MRSCDILSLFLSLSTQIYFACSQFHSKKEALHAGYGSFPTPAVVQEFQQYFVDDVMMNKKKTDLYGVNYTLQHQIIQRFCQRKSAVKTCSWQDYYSLLLHLREAHETLDDLGTYDLKKISIKDIQHRASLPPWKKGQCEVISTPSPSLFYEYIQASRPFVVRGLARDWLALRKWNLGYLEHLLNNLEVPCPPLSPPPPPSSLPQPSYI
jgi:hypothetical protein